MENKNEDDDVDKIENPLFMKDFLLNYLNGKEEGSKINKTCNSNVDQPND